MQPTHGYYMYRVFISAPGDLAADSEACRWAVSETNEKAAMPLRVMLLPVGLQTDEQILMHRAAASENVRAASYFIQIFQDDWGPKNLFRRIFLVALESRDDTALPMREVVVCLKDAPGEKDQEIVEFRRELAESPGVRLIRYGKVEELKQKLLEIGSGWAGELAQGLPGAGTAAGSLSSSKSCS
jgi:hypothetical protein